MLPIATSTAANKRTVHSNRSQPGATAIASAVAGWIYRDLSSGALFSLGSLVALLGALGMLAGRRRGDMAAEAIVSETQRPGML